MQHGCRLPTFALLDTAPLGACCEWFKLAEQQKQQCSYQLQHDLVIIALQYTWLLTKLFCIQSHLVYTVLWPSEWVMLGVLWSWGYNGSLTWESSSLPFEVQCSLPTIPLYFWRFFLTAAHFLKHDIFSSSKFSKLSPYQWKREEWKRKIPYSASLLRMQSIFSRCSLS